MPHHASRRPPGNDYSWRCATHCNALWLGTLNAFVMREGLEIWRWNGEQGGACTQVADAAAP